MKHILLCCGAGMSSGFLAKAIRNAAKEANIDMEVEARSESEVDDYIDSIDMLLVCPHTQHLLDELKETAEPYGVPVEMIDKESYGNIDGKAVLKRIIEVIGE